MPIGSADYRCHYCAAATLEITGRNGWTIPRAGGYVYIGPLSLSDRYSDRLAPTWRSGRSSTGRKSSLPILLGIAFILGLTVTVAEPNTQVLAHYVEMASNGLIGSKTLTTAVALGVALFVALALLRLFLNIPLAYLVAAGCAITLFILIFTPPQFAAISYDAGGVITGPLLVPFVLHWVSASLPCLAQVCSGRRVWTGGPGLFRTDYRSNAPGGVF